MKVLYTSDFLGPHDYRFLRMMQEKSYEVTLVTYIDDLERENEVKSHDVRSIAGLKIIHRPDLAALNYWSFFRRILHFREVVGRERPDVIHAGWIQTSGLLAALSGFRPYVLMPWGSDIIHYAQTSWRNRLISRYAISNAAMITCDSAYEKGLVVSQFHYPEHRVVVIPWDVDLQQLEEARGNSNGGRDDRPEGQVVLLMNRIFRSEYDVRTFLECLPQVIARCPDVRVLLLGDGPQRSELEQLAQGLEIISHIRWEGYVDWETVIRSLASADIYVSTSRMDGSSSSLLEAMAMGLPVVVADIPGNREWIEEGMNGWLVPAGDVKGFAAAIVRLIEDGRKRREMGEANRKTILNRADFRANFRLLEEIYEKVAGESQKGSGFQDSASVGRSV